MVFGASGGPHRGGGLAVTRKDLPGAAFAEWRRDRAYDALEAELAPADALRGARAQARLTQEQVAQHMRTTRTVIARLEGSRTKPSSRAREI
jgi:ribosome-binding protein aMBF1 (putative translation factor)